TLAAAITLAASYMLPNPGPIQVAVTLGVSDTLDFIVGGTVGVIKAASTDLFEFSGQYSNVTIKNFIAGTGSTHDTIQFASNDFADYAAVKSAMMQVGANVVIRLDATDAITLVNKTVSSLVSA